MKFSRFFLFTLIAILVHSQAKADKPGIFDETFGLHGFVSRSLTGGSDWAEVVKLNKDGGFYLAGVADALQDADVFVMKFQKDGSLDDHFGKEGKITIDLGGRERVYGLDVDTDGDIIVGGYSEKKNKNKDAFVMRINPDGNLDESFGREGVAKLDWGGSEELHFLTLEPGTRKIVCAGFVEKKSNADFFVSKINSNGSFDASFGEGGVAITDFTSDDRLYGLALDHLGRIIVAGAVYSKKTNDDCVIARYLSNGTLDTTFGIGGRYIVGASKKQDMCSSVVIDPWDRVIASGFITRLKMVDFLVVALMDNGTPDIGFGDNGNLIVDVVDGTDVAHAIASQSDGTLIVGGEFAVPVERKNRPKSGFAIVAIDPEGKLNRDFGKKGKETIEFKNDTFEGSGALSLDLDAKNNILLSGIALKNIGLVKLVGLPTRKKTPPQSVVNYRNSIVKKPQL